jgi:hypothetical protein
MASVLLIGEARAGCAETVERLAGEELRLVELPHGPSAVARRARAAIAKVDGVFDAVMLFGLRWRDGEANRKVLREASARARSLVVLSVRSGEEGAGSSERSATEAGHELFAAAGLSFVRSFAEAPGASREEWVYHCGMGRPNALGDRLIAALAEGRTELRAESPYFVAPIAASPDPTTSAERVAVLLRARSVPHGRRQAFALGGSDLPPTFAPAVEAGEVALYRFRGCILCGHRLAIVDGDGRLDLLGSYLNRVGIDRIVAPYFRNDLRELLVARDRWVTVNEGEKWVLAANRGFANYFHWMVDCLPSFWFAQRSFREDELRLVAPPLPSFAAETLGWLGIPVDRIHRIEDVPQYFEELYYPTSLHGRIHCFHPRMRSVLSSIAGHAGTRPPPTKLLYVSRADAARRPLANEAELEAALRGLGFETVCPGEHSVAEQRRLFSTARLVVGPHGAGLTNLVFMQPRTTLVELHHPGYLNDCYYRLAQVMNVRYLTFLGDAAGEDGESLAWGVDIQRLTAALRPLLHRVPRRDRR